MRHSSWKTPEYVYRRKSSDWFWALGIISVAIAITSIIFGNVLFAVVILIGSFALALHSAREPKIVHIDVTERGVAVDDNLYLFRSLHSFWIDEHYHDGARLILKSQKVLVPIIMIPIVDTEIDLLREHLLKHLKEEPFEETLSGHIMDRFGF